MPTATNKRVYYAIQNVAIGKDGALAGAAYRAVHGVQQVGINTKFNLEQIFEMGQLSLYENVELVPDVEINIEKVLDGHPLIYHLATEGSTGTGTLANRSTRRCGVVLNIYPDTSTDADQKSGSGPVAEVFCSGMYVSSVGIEVPTEGPAKETVALVGQNKIWKTGGFFANPSGVFGTDVPLSVYGVQRRQHILLVPSGAGGRYTKFPTDILGINASGQNVVQANGDLAVHAQRIAFTASLGREQIFELGRRGPFFRYVNFPIEIRTDIEVLAQEYGDYINADENALTNVTNQTITLRMYDGTYVDVGTQNKLQSVNMGGANAGKGGGNASLTYSYITYNDFIVAHPQDPSALGGWT